MGNGGGGDGAGEGEGGGLLNACTDDRAVRRGGILRAEQRSKSAAVGRSLGGCILNIRGHSLNSLPLARVSCAEFGES